MQNIQEKLLPGRSPWFKTWFDSAYYHKLYANRNDKEAVYFIDALLLELQPQQHATMLDVGCGTGRHCKYLAAKGFNVTGIDLSPASIREAKKIETGSLHFYKRDMRVPFGKNQFDYVFNFFTSFGYFINHNENTTVINNMANALKPGGTLVIDYMNHYYAEDRLVTDEEKEIDGLVYQIKRWADEKFIYKQVSIGDDQWKEPIEYVEQVAKFGMEDFNQMFASCNLKTTEIYGDYYLNYYDRRTSPRLVIVAKK